MDFLGVELNVQSIFDVRLQTLEQFRKLEKASTLEDADAWDEHYLEKKEKMEESIVEAFQKQREMQKAYELQAESLKIS